MNHPMAKLAFACGWLIILGVNLAAFLVVGFAHTPAFLAIQILGLAVVLLGVALLRRKAKERE